MSFGFRLTVSSTSKKFETKSNIFEKGPISAQPIIYNTFTGMIYGFVLISTISAEIVKFSRIFSEISPKNFKNIPFRLTAVSEFGFRFGSVFENVYISVSVRFGF